MQTAYHTPEKLRLEDLFKHFPYYRHTLLDKYERWRRVADILKVSKKAKQRLDWIIWYYEHEGNASLACRHFGIPGKTFYKWFKLFDERNLYTLHLLEDKSRSPRKKRGRTIAPDVLERIIAPRKSNMRYGKMKLKEIYEQTYGETISSWKIQCVITDFKLYYKPSKNKRIQAKRRKAQKKKKTIDLVKNILPWQKRAGYIICLDTIVIYWHGLKRYIFTAVDKYGKVAFARMYTSKSSKNGEDFLLRLHYLLDGQIPRVGHDNGTEFEKYFKAACLELGIEQYYSRVHTPKDNPNNERFNRTLQEEFIEMKGFDPDPLIFNRDLTEWLIEYNFRRPHQSLNYKPPLELSKVLPMYASCTSF
ncbi:transposase [Candidatus Uhrbacteria bacterium]|nr:transposase [Candidatus Uhrbacteria bacterium]